MEKINNKTIGQVMVVVGFIMILINAADYIFGWNGNYISLLIIGLGLGAIGMGLARK
jgi:hypothetical protein